MRNLATLALLFIAFAAYSALTEGASAQVACPTPTPTATVPTPTPLIPTPTRTPSPQPTATPSGGYLFQDEFNSLDTNAWVQVQRDGDPSNGERQCYLAANDVVSGGMLNITTKPDATGCAVTGTSWTQSSGMVQWRNFNFLYGKLEIRAKMPGGQGQMPALWLLGTDCQATNPIDANMAPCYWPQPGAQEIDMTEILRSQYNVINQQIHTATSNQQCLPSFPPPITSASQFSTYFLEWRPNLLIWSIQTVVNGQLSPVTETCRITGSAVPNTPMFLIINAGQGTAGTTNGTVVNVTSPVQMQVDYVRVSP